VKPANIFLSHDGRALVGDFGIAKVQGSTQITRRDQLVGTPNYLAPEQILGEEITPATDVFALGALFYVIATNSPLRTKLDAGSLLAASRGNEPKEKILATKTIPGPLRKVIARALERDARKRWKDGAHFADALSDHATRIPPLGDVPAARPRKATKSSSSKRRSASGPIAAPGSNKAMSAVEQAAQALLNEVAETHGPGSPSKPAGPAPLPVARTESTVMFNLREAEKKEQDKKDKEAADLRAAEKKKAKAASAISMERVTDDEDGPVPVARTESTVMFNLRKAEREQHEQRNAEQSERQQAREVAAHAPIGDDTLDPLDEETSDSLHQDTPLPWADENEANDFAVGADTDLLAVAQPQVKQVIPEAIPRPLPPLDERRIQMLGLSTLGGTLSGLIVVFGLALALRASPALLPKPVQDPSATRKKSVAAAVIPKHCGTAAVDADAKAESQRKTAAATELLSRGRRAQAQRRLQQAVDLDGANVRAHFELAKLQARVRQDAAAAKREYECVVVLDPGSELARRSAKAIKAAGRTD